MLGWGHSSQFKQRIVTFVIVDCPTTYNVILGRLALNIMKAQVCTFRNNMVVPIPCSSWSIRSDLSIPQLCYQTSVKHSAPPSTPIDEQEPCLTPLDQLK